MKNIQKFKNSESEMGKYYCSFAKPYPAPCNPMGCSMPGSSVLHYLPEIAQIHAHRVSDAI